MSDSWLTVAGRRVRYRVDGSGPPVVLLHGIGRSLEDWAEQHDLLRARFRVHSLDLPGYGRSAPLPVPHTLPALADAVAQFCDEVGITGPAHLAGNSLGGAVAMQLAVRDPARVASLVLVNSAGFGREVALALRILAIRPLGWMLLRPSHLAARRVTRSLFHDPTHVTEARVAHALALAREPHAARVMLETLRSLGGVRGVHPQWRTALLDAVAVLPVPVLVTWGDRDLILPVTHLAAARARLPHARTHLFRGCGHLPQVECAEEFSRVVTDFWATPD
ncbi:alpha/beta fold hydrolase [Micromonospora sagamiensis]|uniref:Pimeloyl-ACP methyl ester carboxylesterase n=1 Tax=Micromonospora sagamiensis TaxID=47875 RepID=A0A562WGX1_9ACTN|nr:alpha/beta fold hydrolase [Micromonospora sagamiensis]TWJ29137.1 pimeloyl-ACP methyl ester carboxylesterase [Micromonospora sagamiensis]BCL17838.1 acetoin dehydrogenase [Micromonospora sagamiensis]